MAIVGKIMLAGLVLISLGFSVAGDGGSDTMPSKPKPKVSISATSNQNFLDI